MFDLSKEHENMINPIYGESFLIWLKEQLNGELEVSSPFMEDWGWYSHILWKGRKYLVGSSVPIEEDEVQGSELKWLIQIDKHRTLIEKILGKEKISKTDEYVLFLKSRLASEPRIQSVDFE
jgi:hypothetical protein